MHGRISVISALDSGNYLYVGDCPICNHEIRRVIPKDKHISYPNSWYRQTPKGIDMSPNKPSIKAGPEYQI